MSDLTRFRDHCRAMADTPAASPLQPTSAERALWARLADEVDRYIAGDPDVVVLLDTTDQLLFEVPC